jgi:nucleoside-diphosphate-sugar epimerase
MNLLITGITGFAGTNLVQYFKGIDDINVFGHSRDVAMASRVFGADHVTMIPEVTAALMDQHNIDAVIHLAGIAHDLSNKYGPEDYYRVNDLNTRAVYDEFRRSRAMSFIYVSSIKAVADVASNPVDETATPNPTSDYGKSKLQAENYIVQNPVAGKKYFILRPCMIHGPGNKGNLNLLYKFVRMRLPFPLGAFRNHRSFLSVENFSFVIHQLLTTNIPLGIYHLADSGFLSTADLVRLIGRARRKNVAIWNIPSGIVTLAFTLVGKKRMLQKLTEDMMVSNVKLVSHLKTPLPISIGDGIIKTIRSFDGR